MNTTGPLASSTTASSEQALLDLIESDRARQCALILGQAQARAAAERQQAQAAARHRMRQTFAEQRQRMQQELAAARAQCATQQRLHDQRRIAALLQLAWQQLPAVLHSLWQQPAARHAWVNSAVAAARAQMPGGPWHFVHAADWPAAEREALSAALTPAPSFAPDAGIRAGLKIVAGGNTIDATDSGLLLDRSAVESQLLRVLELSP
jgi:hypothetical protein